MITTGLIVNLLLILCVAWFLGSLFTRFGLPAMLGELLAGVILGPPLLGIVLSSEPIELLADLGIFFVMFHTGMELDPRELLEHIWPSLGVALGGFVLPFVLGYLVAHFFGKISPCSPGWGFPSPPSPFKQSSSTPCESTGALWDISSSEPPSRTTSWP